MIYLLYAVALLCIVVLIFAGMVNHYKGLLAESEEKSVEQPFSKEWINTVVNNEIAAPLSIISGHLQIVEDSGNLPESLTRDVHTALDTVKQVEHFVIELRSLQLYYSPEFRKNLEPIQLDLLLKKCVERHRRRAESRSLQLKLDTDSIEHPVVADFILMEQIVNSLITNSINYTVEGVIEVTAKRHDEKTLITVRDTGVGISQEDIEKLFFSEEIHPELKNGHGAMGLVLVRKAVELLGGKITCNSIVNQGTEIILSLPFAETEMPHQKVVHEEPKSADDEVSLEDLF